MRLPAALAVDAAKLTGAASRLFGRGSGSSLPGMVARRANSDIARLLASQLHEGLIVVSATNGKTTTSRMLSDMMRRAGHYPVHNRSGANLLSGVTTALVDDSSPSGVPRSRSGLFEVDEATLPGVLRELSPRVLVLGNLFRDQLDRFGELDTLADAWQQAISGLSRETHLVLNADDPLVARLGEDAPCPVDYFGIDDVAVGIGAAEHTADSAVCRCGRPLIYRRVFFGHMGIYRCERCGWERPRPTVSAITVASQGLDGVLCDLDVSGERRRIHLRLPGLYNVYNALAAASAALRFGVPLSSVVAGIEGFEAAFGRSERIDAGGRDMTLWLVKNPTGFNESLRTLFEVRGPKAIAILINDKIADGLDVSWLWDVDFELLSRREGELSWILVGGHRAEDMAVRLKYAGLGADRVKVVSDPAKALDAILRDAPAGQPVYCFPTYTAMLDLRGRLERAGWAKPMRDD